MSQYRPLHGKSNCGILPFSRRGKVRAIYEPGDYALVVGEGVGGEIRGGGTPLMCADLKWHYGG